MSANITPSGIPYQLLILWLISITGRQGYWLLFTSQYSASQSSRKNLSGQSQLEFPESWGRSALCWDLHSITSNFGWTNKATAIACILLGIALYPLTNNLKEYFSCLVVCVHIHILEKYKIVWVLDFKMILSGIFSPFPPQLETPHFPLYSPILPVSCHSLSPVSSISYYDFFCDPMTFIFSKIWVYISKASVFICAIYRFGNLNLGDMSSKHWAPLPELLSHRCSILQGSNK